MRLLMVGPVLQVRGPMPRIVRLHVEAFASRGHDVDVEHWGQHNADETPLNKLSQRTADAARILNRIPCHDAVIVHSAHDVRALVREVPLVLGANGRHVPIYYVFHGTPRRTSAAVADRAWRSLFIFLVRRMAGVFVLSQHEKNLLQSWCPDVPVWAVRYPFCPENGYGTPHRDKSHTSTLLFAGRVIVEKGVTDLIAALPHVLQHSECILVVCGDGPALASARCLAADLRVLDHVDFRGWQAPLAVRRAMDESDILVLPSSHSEGFPSVILEAMAAGLPVVTTPVGGVPDYLREGSHARFVPARDPFRLAQVLAELLQDTPARARMGSANLALVQRFAPDQVIDEYLGALGAAS